MTRYDAVNYISHGIAKRPGHSDARLPRGADEEPEAREAKDSKDAGEAKKKEGALEAYCVNLNRKEMPCRRKRTLCLSNARQQN